MVTDRTVCVLWHMKVFKSVISTTSADSFNYHQCPQPQGWTEEASMATACRFWLGETDVIRAMGLISTWLFNTKNIHKTGIKKAP